MSEVASGRGKGGRKRSLNAAHLELLRQITQAHRHASLDEITGELVRQSGISVCSATVRKGLRAAGISRAKPVRKPAARSPVQGRDKGRFGYTDAHRRTDGPSGMNTDLTDAEWALVSDLFERDGGRGAPPRYGRKQIVDACHYVVRTGCAWRLLPKSFPPWRAVYKSFSRWAASGLFEAMHDRLRQQWRDRLGRSPDPSAAIIDAQSTRSTPQGGHTGFDAGKKVKGRKRHLLVDTLGLLLAVSVTAASVQDRDAAPPLVEQAMTKVPGLKKVYADTAYAGRCVETIEAAHPTLRVEIVRRPTNRNTGTWHQGQAELWPAPVPEGFVVQAKRWVVERTHAWNERARRLIAHHDRSSWAPVAWVWLVEARILATRLAT